MRNATLMTLSVLALAACAPELPNSAAGTLPPVNAVSTTPIDGGDSGAALAADTAAALGTAGGTVATAAPMSAMSSTSAVASAAGGTAAGALLSDEQNFAAVSERETIASDAERIAANRAHYQVIEPTALPPRPNGTGASIVAYALATTNAPGQPLYTRTFKSQARFKRNCAKYGGDDRAQEAFLDAGGPQRDRYGMDPDGDGFACYWDPRPFRAAKRGAPAAADTHEVVETPGEG